MVNGIGRIRGALHFGSCDFRRVAGSTTEAAFGGVASNSVSTR
jgi:hypothetical protein